MRLVRPVPFAADSVRQSRSVLSINHGAVRWNDCWWRNTSAARGRRTAVEFNEILSPNTDGWFVATLASSLRPSLMISLAVG